MSQILVVDDEPAICWAFREHLSRDGHKVAVTASAEEALTLVNAKPRAIVLDLRLPGMDGLTALPKLRELFGEIPIIVITAFGDLATAVRAIDQGAFDYLTKPFDLEEAVGVVRRALRSDGNTGAVEAESAATRAESAAASPLVGGSPKMQEVFKSIALAAASDVPVFITGESGTGKELTARAIHQHGRRRGPFLPVCLGSLNEAVIESELFGHVRGAFTGAEVARPGAFELAAGGVLFLDEIAETSPAVQVKLLRVLDHGEFAAVGDARPRRADVRIIAATHRSLGEWIAAGRFRADLFYRLNVFPICLPPLRERPEDLVPLAQYFLSNCGGLGELTDGAIALLHRRRWPGNVRELRNAIEHAAIRARGGPIFAEHFPESTPIEAQDRAAAVGELPDELGKLVEQWGTGAAESERLSGRIYEEFLQSAEPALLQAVLAACGNNRALAARRLGMHRATLRQKLRKYGISDEE